MPPSSDGATLSACRPATASSAVEARLDQRRASERRAEQRVDRDRARHRRGGAAALAAGERQSLPHPRARCRGRGVRARAAQHRARGEPRGVTLGFAREVGVAGVEDLHAGSPRSIPPAPRRPAPATARPTMSSPGPRCPRRRGRRRSRGRRAAHAPASRRMSLSTPAAVTSAPAPGPRDHQRVGLVARGGEHQLVVRPLDGGERTRRRHRPQPDRDLRLGVTVAT